MSIQVKRSQRGNVIECLDGSIIGEGFVLEFPSDLKLFSQFSSKYVPVSNQERLR